MIGRGVPQAFASLGSLIVGMICTQTYIQAIYSASDTRVAVTGTLTAAAFAIPIGLPSVAIGMYMHAAHPDIGPILALPMYLLLYVPQWLGGIGLGGHPVLGRRVHRRAGARHRHDDRQRYRPRPAGHHRRPPGPAAQSLRRIGGHRAGHRHRAQAMPTASCSTGTTCR